MISLIIPPKDMIARVNKMLGDEYGTASNIKSRVNRLSVLSAITSTQQRLKLYNKVPPNGLVLYCGTVLTEDGKERQVSQLFLLKYIISHRSESESKRGRDRGDRQGKTGL